MDSSRIFRSLLTALLVCAAPAVSSAQEQPAEQDTTRPADQQTEEAEPTAQEADDAPEADTADQEEAPADPEEEPAQEDVEQADPTDEEAAPADQEEAPAQGEDAEEAAPQEPVQPAPEAPEEAEPADEAQVEPPAEAPDNDSPIADLASETQDEDFVPLEDVDEGMLESITPAEVYPYVDWNGNFRLRSEANVNFDLNTEGSSAVPPPVDAFTSSNATVDEPVDSEADTIWTTDFRLRLEPTINITESLRLHIETDLFDNVVMGTQQGDENFFGVASGLSDQRPLIRVNEGWGEVDTFLGTLRAGRMDDDWGLGIFTDDGDCLDCSFENPIDRISFTMHAWELYGRLTLDFPSEGVTTQPLLFPGQAYDVGQADDTHQFTVSIFRSAQTREDREIEAHRLRVEKKPVFNGGVYFTYRDQGGFFDPANTLDEDAGELERLRDGQLIYRGLELYIPDLWFEMTYNPDKDTLVRVGLEAVGVFGSVDNATRQPVGEADPGGEAVDCFDEDERTNNERLCTTQGSGQDRRSVSDDIAEFGVALESEFYFGGPVRFGLNGGYASGGPQANWGFDLDEDEALPADQNAFDFYRFNPNYHVDLILFREVLGTVTNAVYGNPWAQVRFLEGTDSRMELQFDAIASAAADSNGTPSAVVTDGEATDGRSWLGLELDAALRYIETENFKAEIEGGVLFPFDGLSPQVGGRRLIQFGDNPEEYGQDFDAELAWTVQGNVFWSF